jgi:predicted nucleic-acid-binding protein
MKKYHLDTNVILRFLLHDHEDLSPKANALFGTASEGNCVLVISDVAIAEAVWVLTSFYKVARENVAEILAKLIAQKGIQCANKDIMSDALTRFSGTNFDFFDCYLAAMAKSSGDGIASFDSDLKKFKDVKLWEH